MRGGTSKAPFFDSADLPGDAVQRDTLLLRLMGSPDARQIDGMGGGSPLTSKIVIVDRSAPPGCDATYTYGRVAITEPHIGYASNCGNLTAAAGVYAIEQGIVAPQPGPTTVVRLFNANTQRVIVVHVPTGPEGYVAAGDFSIAGVPGTGSEIRLDFAATAGVLTGSLLPLGPSSLLDVPGFEVPIEVSVVDVAKPAVYFRAVDVGLAPEHGASDVDEEVLARFWAIRDAAASLLNLGPEFAHLPTPIAVGPPRKYVARGTGATIEKDDVDITVLSALRRGHGIHPALAGTSAVCTAAAAMADGTVANRQVANGHSDLIRLGTPSGAMPVSARFAPDGELVEALFSRTARTLFKGTAFAP
jgi:hypothetical protein